MTANGNGKTLITFSFIQMLAIIFGIIVSTGGFILYSQSRLNSMETELKMLKEVKVTTIDIKVDQIRLTQIETIRNQILMFANLKKLMNKQGVVWENTLPDNYMELIK